MFEINLTEIAQLEGISNLANVPRIQLNLNYTAESTGILLIIPCLIAAAIVIGTHQSDSIKT